MGSCLKILGLVCWFGVMAITTAGDIISLEQVEQVYVVDPWDQKKYEKNFHNVSVERVYYIDYFNEDLEVKSAWVTSQYDTSGSVEFSRTLPDSQQILTHRDLDMIFDPPYEHLQYIVRKKKDVNGHVYFGYDTFKGQDSLVYVVTHVERVNPLEGYVEETQVLSPNTIYRVSLFPLKRGQYEKTGLETLFAKTLSDLSWTTQGVRGRLYTLEDFGFSRVYRDLLYLLRRGPNTFWQLVYERGNELDVDEAYHTSHQVKKIRASL